MSTVNELHDKAMEFVDQAFFARRRGDIDNANELTRKALKCETEASDLLRNELDAEPTRSVLYRSAASLALECGELREAERLIARALCGEPPAEIAEELRDLLDQTHFARHLRLQNIDLSTGELQLSIAGNVIGAGIALSEVLVERIKDMERLIYRTVERILGRDFREHGSTHKGIRDGYSLYIAAPRTGSFAVTLRLGRQRELPGIDLSNDVIDEMFECLDLLNQREEDRLKEKIPDEPYFQNFIGLAKRIAPDGDKVNMVGLTKVKGGNEVKLALTRIQKEISNPVTHFSPATGEIGKPVTVTGRLLLADATKTTRKIQIIETSGAAYSIVVPEGMMDDIVKPLWDEVVVVSGLRVKKRIFLKEISRAE